MNDAPLVLCESCSELIELEPGALETIAHFQERLGLKVVVHCHECFDMFSQVSP